MHLTRLVLPYMLKRGAGIVVNMTSISGMIDPPEKGAWGFGYGATKAALHRMAGLLQREYGDRGIRAYNLEPGMTRSEFLLSSMEASDLMQPGVRSAPVEVPAAVAAWLCTDPGAVEFAGQNLHAQPFCAKRGLLPGWPPRKGAPKEGEQG